MVTVKMGHAAVTLHVHVDLHITCIHVHVQYICVHKHVHVDLHITCIHVQCICVDMHAVFIDFHSIGFSPNSCLGGSAGRTHNTWMMGFVQWMGNLTH